MRNAVVIDLDGTLADYAKGWQGLENIGDPIPGAVEFVNEIAKYADVIIHTCRVNMEGRDAEKAKAYIEEWLDRNGFQFSQIWMGAGKPIASAYVDDRGVGCAPQVGDPATAYRYARSKVMHLLFPPFNMVE